jgi:hypothetical protein
VEDMRPFRTKNVGGSPRALAFLSGSSHSKHSSRAHCHGVLDPILASPYRPAARDKSHIEAGHTSAPDHMLTEGKNLLAFTGASTHVRAACGLTCSEQTILAHRCRRGVPPNAHTYAETRSVSQFVFGFISVILSKCGNALRGRADHLMRLLLSKILWLLLMCHPDGYFVVRKFNPLAVEQIPNAV